MCSPWMITQHEFCYVNLINRSRSTWKTNQITPPTYLLSYEWEVHFHGKVWSASFTQRQRHGLLCFRMGTNVMNSFWRISIQWRLIQSSLMLHILGFWCPWFGLTYANAFNSNSDADSDPIPRLSGHSQNTKFSSPSAPIEYYVC